jgi:hypothetical protein
VTGDYGTGKSSFGLLLARLLSGEQGGVPAEARGALEQGAPGASARMIPLLVTGNRVGMGATLVRSLLSAVAVYPSLAPLEGRARDAQARGATDEDALALVRAALALVAESEEDTGLVLIIDELGKFLEAAALRPHQHDVFLLQQLAEEAARSGAHPFLVLGLLHQGFQAYAEGLTPAAQSEWEKVAGRFEEIPFDTPLAQTPGLVAGALRVDLDRLPADVSSLSVVRFKQALKWGWYGPVSNAGGIAASAPGIYPLDPLVLPAFKRLISRFGQNERSLFGFLFSADPSGIQEFAEHEVDPRNFYRLHNLYDYVRASLGHRLGAQALRTNWIRISGTLESVRTDDPREVEVLKTVALLNLLDDERMLARREVLLEAVSNGTVGDEDVVSAAIDALVARRLLHRHGVAGGYRLWPHTSVDLDRAYREATNALGSVQRASLAIGAYADPRPLVARRHYIQTGNLRHFRVQYAPPGRLAQSLGREGADGLVLVALCDSEAEREEAIRFAHSEVAAATETLIVGVPAALEGLRHVVEEVQRWDWVIQNTLELNHDAYAAEEASRQFSAATEALLERVNQTVGLRGAGAGVGIRWFRGGSLVLAEPGGRLASFLSAVCDEVYHMAPRVDNELVNRAVLSSAAAGARMRVIEGVLERSHLPTLGIPEDKTPPERSVYFSLFEKGKLHRAVGGVHAVVLPEPDGDPCNLRPALGRMRELLNSAPDQRLRADELFRALREAPYGVRDGLIPLLLAVFAKVYEANVALYESGSFIPRPTGFDLLRLIKAPDTFDVQFSAVEGVRAEVFAGLLRALAVPMPAGRAADLMDVLRPLATFAHQLPDHAKRTRRLSDVAQRVRATIFAAQDTATLLFRELPQACGFEAFPPDVAADPKRADEFVTCLRSALDEIRSAYPMLRQRIADQLASVFNLPATPDALREALSGRAEAVLPVVSEPELRAFCLRLADRKLPVDEWIDSVASLVASKPPARWHDFEADQFAGQLHPYVARLSRVAHVAAERGDLPPDPTGLRVAVTRGDGREQAKVLFLSEVERSQAQRVQSEVARHLDGTAKVRMAALSRLLWEAIQEDEAADSTDAALAGD